MKLKHVRCIGACSVFALSTLAACGGSSSVTPKSLTLLAYDSFTPSKGIFDEFTKDTGITVNVVHPPFTKTDRYPKRLAARAKELGISLDEMLVERAKETAVGRIGEPRELANLVAFLASGKASYVTGTTIRVDGGLVRSVL